MDEANLERFLKVHRVPRTARAAGRWATLQMRADDPRWDEPQKPRTLPIEDTMSILRNGKKRYYATREASKSILEWLESRGHKVDWR